MVLLCFGSYFAGIRRKRAKSGKLLNSETSDATLIRVDATLIRVDAGCIRPDAGRIASFQSRQQSPKSDPLPIKGGPMPEFRELFPPLHSRSLREQRSREKKEIGACLKKRRRREDCKILSNPPWILELHYDLPILSLFHVYFCYA